MDGSSRSADSVSVTVLYPFPVRTDLLPTSIRGRELEVQSVRYFDEPPARTAKATGAPNSEVRALEAPVDDDVRRALTSAEVVLALDLPVDVRDLAPRMRWVQAYGAGVGQLVRVLDGTGVGLSSAAGVGADAIAEFVLARLLQVRRDLRTLDELQRRHDWQPHRTDTLAGLRLLVLGVGAIGSRIVRLALAFGMDVTAVRRRPERGVEGLADSAVVGADKLLDALAGADVVVIAAAETSSTSGILGSSALIGRTELAVLRPGATLVNVARGSLVDEPAVVQALRAGHLGAAILDVTAEEPLPADSPLWDLPGAYLSPHSSTSPTGYDDRLLRLFADNLTRYVEGRDLVNAVDAGQGY